jgi:Prokaryotic Cytochrome C oxidase subunit IV
MSEIRKLDLAWLGLVLLSLAGARLGTAGDSDFGITAIIALVMGIKVRLVCDYFLELRDARPLIRHAMYAFCYGMPALVILSTAFGPAIVRLSSALI